MALPASWPCLSGRAVLLLLSSSLCPPALRLCAGQLARHAVTELAGATDVRSMRALARRRAPYSPTCAFSKLLVGTPRLLCCCWHACCRAGTQTGTMTGCEIVVRSTPDHWCASLRDLFGNPWRCGPAAKQLTVAASVRVRRLVYGAHLRPALECWIGADTSRNLSAGCWAAAHACETCLEILMSIEFESFKTCR